MLTIGLVARRVGIRPLAIRCYEAQGILRPAARPASGYRVYSDDAVKLLLFVKRSQSLGISLKEMKPLIHLASQGQQHCGLVKQLARTHLKDIDQKSTGLETLRKQLHKLLRDKIARPHANEICRMIERGASAAG